jgi:hypothetical protein
MGDFSMRDDPGFFDIDARLEELSAKGDEWRGLRGSSKDMFDESADLRLLAIGPGDGLWHRFGLGLFAMDFLSIFVPGSFTP